MKEAESQGWCEALDWFRRHYKMMPSLPFESEESGWSIDPRVVIQIMIDRENTQPAELLKLHDYTEVQKAKKIWRYLSKKGFTET